MIKPGCLCINLMQQFLWRYSCGIDQSYILYALTVQFDCRAHSNMNTCDLASSTSILAAGCVTDILFRMVAPSLVMMTSPLAWLTWHREQILVAFLYMPVLLSRVSNRQAYMLVVTCQEDAINPQFIYTRRGLRQDSKDTCSIA